MDDFFITSIGGETATGDNFWAICLNFVPTKVGGCQQKVKKDDQVLFAYANRNATKHYLKLSGPDHWIVLVLPVMLTVTDEAGAPVLGASVNGKFTDSQGRVFITFDSAGIKKLKATKQDSVRSNEHVIHVRLFVKPTDTDTWPDA